MFTLTCQWFDSFANMVWKMKGIGCHALLFLVLLSIYMYKMLVVLQQMHATSILNRVIIVGEGYYEPIVISCVPSLFLSIMLFATTRFEYLICSCTLAICLLW